MTSSPPAERLMQRRYRQLIRKHLSRVLDTLFAELTGLHFHIAWAPASPKGWDAHTLPTGCSVCCKLSGSPMLPTCRACGPHRLAATLASNRGHRFTCRLGVRNYWLPIRVCGQTLGIAYLQALDHTVSGSPARKPSGRGKRGRLGRAGGVVLSPLKFARGARFLGYIVQQVQTASLNDLRKADLRRAGSALVALEREQARLHAALRRHLPAAPQVPRSSGPASHTEQVVHGLLERMELDYAKPITLRQLGRELGMNPAYLSTLFSRSVGIPFKAYLTDLRLQKAKELLGHPTETVSDVAFAVGYSSGDRFRSAFKKATGLSPKTWRETMQTHPADPSALPGTR